MQRLPGCRLQRQAHQDGVLGIDQIGFPSLAQAGLLQQQSIKRLNTGAACHHAQGQSVVADHGDGHDHGYGAGRGRRVGRRSAPEERKLGAGAGQAALKEGGVLVDLALLRRIRGEGNPPAQV